jgi:hypothetical protein
MTLRARRFLLVLCALLHSGGVLRADGNLAPMIRRFAPTVFTAEISGLKPEDREALDRILAAVRLLDPLYLQQVWSGNEALAKRVAKDTSPAGKERMHYFRMNAGPWSRLDDDLPFIPGVPPRPPGANFYPEDMTKDEFNAWLVTLSASEKQRAQGFFTVIRRTPQHTLKMVPYSEEYKDFLEPIAKLLEEAAGLTSNAGLRKYLKLRAAALRDDDYYSSDIAWMELDSPIDVIIGPYETDDDKLFGFKAAFEGYVNIDDHAETAKVAHFAKYLQELEDHLPMDPPYRNPMIGTVAPIRVVRTLLTAGQARSGVQGSAYNLPNDDRVIKAKGSKRVLLKNVQEARFNAVISPLARLVLAPEAQGEVSFEAYFIESLVHQLVHGIGPRVSVVNGEKLPVRKALQQLFSLIEETKADVATLWSIQYLIDKGAMPATLARSMFTTHLVNLFRYIRCGQTDAHPRSAVLQFNYLTRAGAIRRDERSGRFTIEPGRMKVAVAQLTRDVLMMQAEGAQQAAQSLVSQLANIGPDIQTTLDRLTAVPVDFEPVFPIDAGK